MDSTENIKEGLSASACSGCWFKDLESLLFTLDGIREKARDEGYEYFADELDAAAKIFRYIVTQSPVRELPPVERFLGCLQNAQAQTPRKEDYEKT